jgi:hypothetical protein
MGAYHRNADAAARHPVLAWVGRAFERVASVLGVVGRAGTGGVELSERTALPPKEYRP